MSNGSRRRAGAARQPSPRPAAAARTPPAQAALVPPPAAAATATATVVFHLGALANEAIRTRFTFDIPHLTGDRVWYFRAPEELNWLEHAVAVQLAAMDDLRPFLREVLGEQYDEFVKVKIAVGEIWGLINQWQRHYGVTLPEFSASSRS